MFVECIYVWMNEQINKWMNEATGATVCLRETSLGKSAGGGTETARGREQGSMNSFRHNCLKCPCPCTALCCSVIHNRMHLPRHGNSSWVDRKADTKPLLIKKLLQLELPCNTKCCPSWWVWCLHVLRIYNEQSQDYLLILNPVKETRSIQSLHCSVIYYVKIKN